MAVLCGFTGTKGGEDSLTVGWRLATALKTELVPVIVIPQSPTLAPRGADLDVLMQEQAKAWLETAIRHCKIPADSQIEPFFVVASSATEGLVLAAESHPHASCLVVGGGKHAGFGKIGLGSIGESLAHVCPIPLVISPRGARKKPAVPLSRINVGVGRKANRDCLFGIARNFAAASNLPVRCLSLLANKDTAGNEDAVTVLAQQALTAAAEKIGTPYVRATEVVVDDTIEEAAKSIDWQPGDMLLLGSGRLATPKRLFLSSFGSKIMRTLPIPLMIVPREQ